jgi:hypothetical protein
MNNTTECVLTGGDWGDVKDTSKLPSRIYLNVSREWFREQRITLGQKYKLTLEKVEE